MKVASRRRGFGVLSLATLTLLSGLACGGGAGATSDAGTGGASLDAASSSGGTGGGSAGNSGGSGGSSGSGGSTGSGGSGAAGGAGGGSVGLDDTLACPGETKGTWVAMSQTMAPGPGSIAKLLWTGTHVYATASGGVGGLFDPCANAWQTSPTPTHSWQFIVPVPADNRFLFFWPERTTFEAFDYGQNLALTLSATGAINADFAIVASTGAKMLGWGGAIMRVVNGADVGWDGTQTGAAYDPAKDAWTPMTTAGAPAARVAPGAWTGTQLAVWGGHSATSYMQGTSRVDCADEAYDDKSYDCIQYGDGALYDPARDTWTPIANAGAPKPRFEHLLAWTGDRILVWGGGEQGTPDPTLFTPGKQWLSDGGLYDPVAQTWTTVAASPLPDSGYDLSAYWVLWTGHDMATGQNGGVAGWFLDPHTNLWSTLTPPAALTGCEVPIATQAGALVAVCTINATRAVALRLAGESTWRSYPLPDGVAQTPSVLWTGKRLFVWGGSFPPTYTCPPPSPQMPGCDPPPPTYSNAGFMLIP
jgi:hypothetical protein